MARSLFETFFNRWIQFTSFDGEKNPLNFQSDEQVQQNILFNQISYLNDNENISFGLSPSCVSDKERHLKKDTNKLK